MSGTIVIIASKTCGHCVHLLEELPKIMKAVNKVYPDVSFVIIKKNDMKEKISSKYPEDFNYYSKWYPCILFLEGTIYLQALSLIQAGKKVSLKKYISVMNGRYDEDGKLKYKEKYDVMKGSDYIDFIQTCLSKK